jgi:hypothetical protein
MLEGVARQQATAGVPQPDDRRLEHFGERIQPDHIPPRKGIAAASGREQEQQQRDESAVLKQKVGRQVSRHVPVNDACDAEFEHHGQADARDILADALSDGDAQQSSENNRHRKAIPYERAIGRIEVIPGGTERGQAESDRAAPKTRLRHLRKCAGAPQ